MNEHNGNRPGNGDSRLARLYRETAREEPQARLDEAIRAAARREVGAGPQSLGVPFLRSWRLPVSIAAVVVLSVSVVTLMMKEGGERPDEPAGTAPKAVSEKAAETTGPATAPSKPVEPTPPETAPAAQASSARQAPGVAPTAEKSIVSEAAKQPAPATATAVVPRPFPATPSFVASTEQRAAEPASVPQRDGAAAPAAAVSAPPIPAGAASAPSNIAGSVDASSRAAPTEDATRDDTREKPDAVLRSARQRPAQPELARESSSGTIGTRGSGEEASLTRSERVAPQAAVPAPAAKPAPPTRKSALVREYENQPPEKWLDKIAELRRQGRAAEADELLAEFKKRFLDYPLPASLR